MKIHTNVAQPPTVKIVTFTSLISNNFPIFRSDHLSLHMKRHWGCHQSPKRTPWGCQQSPIRAPCCCCCCWQPCAISRPMQDSQFSAEHCTLLYTPVQWTVYTIHYCTLYSGQCTLYTTVHCTPLYTVHCTPLYTIHCTAVLTSQPISLLDTSPDLEALKVPRV